MTPGSLVMLGTSHRRRRRQVMAYVDGEVDANVGHDAAEHIRECWDCSGEADLLRLVKHALNRLGSSRPDDLTAARLKRWARGLGSQ
ncbi:MAG: hypothetical protein ACRDJP_13455 [Actinomycetota bacterium]